MHHFVVKFTKFSSPQAAMGHWSPNQNPADVPASSMLCWWMPHSIGLELHWHHRRQRSHNLVSRGRSTLYPRQSLSSFCCRVLNDIAVNPWTRRDASINSNNDTKTVSINHGYRHFRVNFRLNIYFRWFCADFAGTHDALYSANVVVQ